ncbi:hypothetical protein B0A75_15715, partial [Flavobacterium oncorhynchi]
FSNSYFEEFLAVLAVFLVLQHELLEVKADFRCFPIVFQHKEAAFSLFNSAYLLKIDFVIKIET